MPFHPKEQLSNTLMHGWRLPSPWELWVPPDRKELCLQSGEQELHLPRAANRTDVQGYCGFLCTTVEPRGSSICSERSGWCCQTEAAWLCTSCWGWDSPCSSPAGAHVLSHKQGSSSSCQALSEATHTSASGCTCTFSQVPQCLADSLDSLPLGNQAQKKGHFPHISATAGLIRQTSVKET